MIIRTSERRSVVSKRKKKREREREREREEKTKPPRTTKTHR